MLLYCSLFTIYLPILVLSLPTSDQVVHPAAVYDKLKVSAAKVAINTVPKLNTVKKAVLIKAGIQPVAKLSKKKPMSANLSPLKASTNSKPSKGADLSKAQKTDSSALNQAFRVPGQPVVGYQCTYLSLPINYKNLIIFICY